MPDPVITPVVLTKAGRKLLGKVLAGKELKFTKVVAGDGYLSESVDIYEMTGLVSPRKELPIVSVRANRKQIGEAVVTSVVTNEGQDFGFFLREAGIYALDPDEGEILYSYKNEGDECSYLPGQGGPDIIQWTWSFAVVIDQAENVTAVFDEHAIFVTQEELDDKLDGLFGSPMLPVKDIWTRTEGDGKKLRPVSLDEFKQAVLGVTDISSLDRRLETVETNQGETQFSIEQLWLKLDVKDTYPDYENLLAEDFNPANLVDTYICNVIAAVAGDDSLDCNPVAGMYPGSGYTIADGVNFERVQVKSVSIENGIQRVILAAPILNRYNLADCKLYRTTGTIHGGTAFGPMEPGNLSWTPSTGVWQGQAADQEILEKLDTSVGGAAAFDIEGEISFTAGNLVTLEAM